MNSAKVRLVLPLLLVIGAAAAAAAQAPRRDTETSSKAVQQIDIYVTPYYESAKTPDSHPTVAVATAFDTQLSSNKREDILAVRDAIQAQSKLITPMTLMVLAIRLYDVGMRDDAAFWFYVAKERYLSMADVLDMKAASLAPVDDAMRAFATLPFNQSISATLTAESCSRIADPDNVGALTAAGQAEDAGIGARGKTNATGRSESVTTFAANATGCSPKLHLYLRKARWHCECAGHVEVLDTI